MRSLVAIAFALLYFDAYCQNVPEIFEKAAWITPGFAEDTIQRPPVIFQTAYSAHKKVRLATLYVTAHGLYEATINDKRVGNAYFTPGWTSYDHRIAYQQYDVSSLFKKGGNDITVTVAEGWWRGAFGHFLRRNNYGNDAAMICALHITYADGSRDTIYSDTTWQCSTGPILYSDLYNGEVFDARITPPRWWPVHTQTFPKDVLVPSEAEPITQHEQFPAKRIFTTLKGEQVIDFGQNLSGWVRVKVKGKAGDTIKIAHAELLDTAGNFYTGNLRQAKATDMYILKGGGTETFEPHFTYHGFRYIKIQGCDARKNHFTGIALYNDLRPAGTFTCSDPLINRLHHNIAWSLKSNFFSIPTDCPQRSERLGWTGDAQVFSKAAAYLFDVRLFFRAWLQDLSADQGTNGAVPEYFGVC